LAKKKRKKNTLNKTTIDKTTIDKTTTSKAILKKQHRDTMFRAYFKMPHNFLDLLKKCRDDQLSLMIDDIEPFDLDSSIAVRIRRNDVSFMTKDKRLIILIEHQSTINPNMAFRLFIYFIELLQLWVKISGIDLYSTNEIPKLPIPEFYVVYNGVAPLKEKSSVFKLECKGMKIDVEVKIVDIHFDNLKDIESDNALAGYAYFYKVYAEQIKKGLSAEKAFDIARAECIKNSYLIGFIDKEEFIVIYKDILDYDTQLKAEGKIEGLIEGEIKGFDVALAVAKGLLRGISPMQLATEYNRPIEDIEKIQQELLTV